MKWLLLAICAALTAGALHLVRSHRLLERFTARSDAAQPAGMSGDGSAVSPQLKEESAVDRWSFYQANILPLEMKSRLYNQEATGRALSRVADQIETYRGGIKPFIREITGWGTRLKVIWHLPGDSFFDGSEISSLIRRKFDEHLFSEEKLRTDLERIFVSLQEDLQANQNRLLAEARAIAEENGKEISFPDVSSFSERVRSRLVAFAENTAKESALNGLISFVTATAVSIGAEQLVIRLVAASGTSAAFGGIAAGGATAGGAGGGAAAGTAAGPAGTIAGFIAGLVIGIAVDWWMTEHFQEKTSAELNQQLDTLRDTLLTGGPADQGQGLQKVLPEFTNLVDTAQDEQLRTIFGVTQQAPTPLP